MSNNRQSFVVCLPNELDVHGTTLNRTYHELRFAKTSPLHTPAVSIAKKEIQTAGWVLGDKVPGSDFIATSRTGESIQVRVFGLANSWGYSEYLLMEKESYQIAMTSGQRFWICIVENIGSLVPTLKWVKNPASHVAKYLFYTAAWVGAADVVSEENLGPMVAGKNVTEERAMEASKRVLANSYSRIEDVSKLLGEYDYRCFNTSEEIHVEVKGSDGRPLVEVRPGQFNYSFQNPTMSWLYVAPNVSQEFVEVFAVKKFAHRVQTFGIGGTWHHHAISTLEIS